VESKKKAEWQLKEAKQGTVKKFSYSSQAYFNAGQKKITIVENIEVGAFLYRSTVTEPSCLGKPC
jgi:hypothetical protein